LLNLNIINTSLVIIFRVIQIHLSCLKQPHPARLRRGKPYPLKSLSLNLPHSLAPWLSENEFRTKTSKSRRLKESCFESF